MQRLKKYRQIIIYAIGVSAVFSAHAKTSPIFDEMDNLMLQEKTAKTVTTNHYPLIDSLELVGVGISVETWRNHPNYPKVNLWEAVEKSNGSYIISQDPKQYPKNIDESQMVSAKRKEDAVDIAMRDFMDRYPLPIAVVGPGWRGTKNSETEIEETRKSNADSFVITKHTGPYTAVGEFAGLLTQSGQVVNSFLNDNPDKLWNTLFKTFEENEDIPAVGVAAKDGVIQRAGDFYTEDHSKFEKMAQQAYEPKLPRIHSDNWTFIALARPGRIDWLRPYAPLVEDTMIVKVYRSEGDNSRNRSQFKGWKKQPPQPFVATPFIAKPWTSFQIDQYDHLQNLGTLHRPQVISYLDEQGKPIKEAERTIKMEKALRAALAPLDGKMPVRIFFDYGSVWQDRPKYSRFLPLVQGMRAVDINEEVDWHNTKYSYDLAQILGDLGAGSPFVAVALASMAGMQSGGATLIANLRRDDGATLMLVTPPSAEQIAKDAAIKRPFWPRKGAYHINTEKR